MMCVNCNKEIKDNNYKRCFKCGFSICSKCKTQDELELCASCTDDLFKQ